MVNDAFELRGLITVKDIIKTTEHPLASKDAGGRLRVGAAIGVGPAPRNVPNCWRKPGWM